MTAILKIVICVVGYEIAVRLWPQSFNAGYVCGVVLMVVLGLMGDFVEGWRKAKS